MYTYSLISDLFPSSSPSSLEEAHALIKCPLGRTSIEADFVAFELGKIYETRHLLEFMEEEDH